jgi:integrase
MFRLWQHNNGNWYILHGPRLKRRVSTGTKDRRQAEIALTRFVAGYHEPTIPGLSVREVLHGYRDDHGKAVRSPNSLKFAVKAVERHIGDLQVSDLTPTTMKQYALVRAASNGTILREVGVLRAAGAWAKAHRLIKDFPALPNPCKAPPPRSRWLTKEEAVRLIRACQEPHVRLFVTLACMTVARSGAILEARWGQVDWDRLTLDYGQGHGNKRRAIVPLNDDAMRALRAAQEMACTNYIVEWRGGPVSTVKTGFAAACRRAGLDDVTPHTLRHSGISWMVEADIPDEQIARISGDTPDMIRRVYGHFRPGYLSRAATALQLGNKT